MIRKERGMATVLKQEFDHYDHRILTELQKDARISMAELGRRVHMSQPAVTERVRKLEETGVITGYRAVVDPEALGYQIRAVVRIGGQAPSFERVTRLISESPEIITAYNVTGEDSWVMEIAVANVRHLDEVVTKFNNVAAETSTSIILRVVKSQVVLQPPSGAGG